jgi:diaminohydroxyphosphoribosylaminopyrimidine deaminase/5-amino-6-(5-phosphoribosylamino)uracil reductase
MDEDEHFMRQALLEAARADYTLSPNPKVGCLIVKNNEILSRGYHQGSGTPHAEIDALTKIGETARGADLYVTLEPCCHFGKTPPCTESIIRSGIKRVFYAMIDPNPQVAGRGIEALLQAGIEVIQGYCETEARVLNRFFIHFMTERKPYVIAKWAMSLDGKMTTPPKDNRQITSLESQLHLHHTRNNVDAILVGVNTIMADNPALTTRYIDSKNIKHPLRIILDTHGRIPLNAQVLNSSLPGKTVIATTILASHPWRQSIQHAEVWILPIKNDRVDLKALLVKLAERQIMSLLVEGGRGVLESFIEQNLIQETQVYLAPVLISNLPIKKTLHLASDIALGPDKFFQFIN